MNLPLGLLEVDDRDVGAVTPPLPQLISADVGVSGVGGQVAVQLSGVEYWSYLLALLFC